MKITSCYKRIIALMMCLLLTFSFGTSGQATDDDWLLSYFLLAILDEYGLHNVEDLLALMDADSVADLYAKYNDELYEYGTNSFINENSNNVEYYDADGYAVYLDERTGFYYGLYDDDTAYIIGHQGLLDRENTNLLIPANVEGYPVYDIYEYAFQNVKGIGSVTVQEGVQRISIGAFMGSDIENITLPESISHIEYDAFSGCNSLEWVSFSEGLQYIGACAFMNCISLKDAILPDSLTEIDFDTFSGCTAMTQVRLGVGLASITGNIFSLCPSLVSLQIAEGNPYFINDDGLLINMPTGTLLRYDSSIRSETSFTVPDGIKVIGEMCFEGAEALTTVVFPDSVVILEDYALWGCVGLSTIDMGCVETIGYNAVNANSMREVVLPDTISSMDDQAFCLRSDAADIGGSRIAYATPGTKAYNSAVANGFVVRPMNEYQPALPEQTAEPKPAEPVVVITPDYVFEGELVTIECLWENMEGDIEFNIQGTSLGKVPMQQGKAVVHYKADKSGVYTVTALMGRKSIAMERFIVATPGYTPEFHQLNLPCRHEAGHMPCDPNIDVTYEKSSYEVGHYKHTQTSEAWVCNRCGMYMIDDPISSEYIIEEHMFIDQECVCGTRENEDNGISNRYKLDADLTANISGEYYMSVGDIMYVTIIDTVTNARVWPDQNFKLMLVNSDGSFTEIEPGMYRAESYGTAEIALFFGDKEIDRLTAHCTLLELAGWFSGGEASATSVVMLNDMQKIDWRSNVLRINNRVTLENFEAIKNDGEYEVSFNAYNSSSMAFGAYSYDKYGNIVDRQFIGGMWYSGSVLGAAMDFVETTGKLLLFGRNTLMTTGTQKSEINLTVPEGGFVCFLTAKDDEYVQAYNSLLLAAGVVSSVTDISSGLTAAINGSIQSGILEKLLEINNAIDIGKIIADSSQETFARNLASALDENTISQIVMISAEVTGKAIWGKAEEELLNYLTLDAYEKINAVSGILGDMGCLELMRRDLNAAYGDEPIVWPQFILFPETY